jgi:hypothetical protein
VRPESLAVVVLAVTTSLAGAHHSVLSYDNEHATRLMGRIERVLFANPHTLIVLDVARDDGTRERWTVEGEGATLLRRLGWDETVIEAGDRVTAIGGRALDGSTSMRCQRLELEDGRELQCFSADYGDK